MKSVIDYWHWPTSAIYEAEFGNFLVESLAPSSTDLFVRRMEDAFPGFSGYLITDLPVAAGCVAVSKFILDRIPEEKLRERSDAFSYNMTRMSSVLMFKPRMAPSGLPKDTFYVHLSPVDCLDINGIRCKASGRFEEYEPRIYLVPLYSLVDSSLPPDEQYTGLIGKCREIAGRFNDVYLGAGKISKAEPYNVYLVRLPDGYPVYDDFSTGEASVYVENNIPASAVRKVGRIEPTVESEK